MTGAGGGSLGGGEAVSVSVIVTILFASGGVRVGVLVGVRVGVRDGLPVRVEVGEAVLVSEESGVRVRVGVSVETTTGGSVGPVSGINGPGLFRAPRNAAPRAANVMIPPIMGTTQPRGEEGPPLDRGGVRGGAPPGN